MSLFSNDNENKNEAVCMNEIYVMILGLELEWNTNSSQSYPPVVVLVGPVVFQWGTRQYLVKSSLNLYCWFSRQTV